jgi:general secretion pathway protein E
MSIFGRFKKENEINPSLAPEIKPSARVSSPVASVRPSSGPIAPTGDMDALATTTTRGLATFVEQSLGGFTLRVAHEHMTSEATIASSLSFVRTLGSEIALSPSFMSQICPLELSTGSKKYAILCTEKMLGSSELQEVLGMLSKKGFMLAEGLQPNLYICKVESVILSVARGDITGEDVAKRKKVLGNSADGLLWRNFLELIAFGVRHDASDIHLNIVDLDQRSQVKYTIDGQYVAPEHYRMATSLLTQMAFVAWQQSKGGNGPSFEPSSEQQCRIFTEINTTGKPERVMLRWASLATDDGPQITLRVLKLDSQTHSHTLESLGYLPGQCESFRRAMLSEGGAIVASGVLGSGKSTLLATLMSAIPRTHKIVTFEDPREYVIDGAHQNTLVRALEEEDANSFLAKKRTLKRTGFHEFMIGEIRDRETGEVFQDVVESGPNVYTTVHSRRHIGIADRLASPSIGVDRNVLATPGILKLLVCQVLLPLSCEHCAIPATEILAKPASFDGKTPTEWKAYFNRINRLFDLEPSPMRLRNRLGCRHCIRDGLPELAGYKGRIVAAEMVEPDDIFLELVRDAKNIELARYVTSLRRSAITEEDSYGKSALEVSLFHVHKGRIDPRSVEPRFESFETIEMRNAHKRAVGLKAVA